MRNVAGNRTSMALPISNVPILTGEVAERFIKKTDYNAKYLKGSKYDAGAPKKCMDIIERSRRFMKKRNGNDIR